MPLSLACDGLDFGSANVVLPCVVWFANLSR